MQLVFVNRKKNPTGRKNGAKYCEHFETTDFVSLISCHKKKVSKEPDKFLLFIFKSVVY